MTVLVAHASRHGATAGIAERIAAALADRGFPAEALPVEEVDDLDGYDAVVLGGAAYLGRWLAPATGFARQHQRELAARPVWLFSSGPLGTERTDERGQDLLATCRPREFDELTRLLEPRGEVVFYGAYDPASPPAGLGERVVRHMPGSGTILPEGDFRDWSAIDAWARDIADDLAALQPT